MNAEFVGVVDFRVHRFPADSVGGNEKGFAGIHRGTVQHSGRTLERIRTSLVFPETDHVHSSRTVPGGGDPGRTGDTIRNSSQRNVPLTAGVKRRGITGIGGTSDLTVGRYSESIDVGNDRRRPRFDRRTIDAPLGFTGFLEMETREDGPSCSINRHNE
ncbi:hypothetical protein V7x_10420 [Crateriforma conspicua]|uniref:Uncharacterized protein n=1 Tax=Crateriforma conspicua TaxID=2527996 RepID=A0A5C6FV73_9PLAN|nr:hypothetical protein V7x_10420 [Crateriforma conspicua]